MSEASKAVFLSYASQDVEEAKRICDALRAAGVEVWFDTDGGLEHGDEWDAKIRRQIKECILFLPIISANTQAREEGYFRIEWDLAAERARGIASGVAFILPVVIDDTKEPLALVPDRFRSVQWTRLPGGAVPADVRQRFLKLWSHRAGMVKQAQRQQAATEPPAAAASGRPLGINGKWFVAVGLVLFAVAAYLFLPRTIYTVHDAPAKPAGAAVAPPPVSPARELVAKARELTLALDATREDFALAEEYCQRALKLDPDDAEVWAVYSQVHSAFGYRGWDTSPERRDQTRTTAERAMRLAPQSTNARLAQAGAWATFGINREQREKLLREILRDEPDNQEVLRFLAVTVLPKPGGLEEALALNERSAALPGGDPLALFNNARYLWTAGQPAKGYEVLQRSLAQRKFTSALVLKMSMELTWRGDLAAGEDTLRQINPSTLQEDRANYSAGLLRYYQRDAAGALEVWGAFPRDFYVDFVFDGPKGLLLGLAHELDQRDAAARTEWRAALREVEKKIAAAPNRAAPYYSQAYLLACLGEKAAAEEALRTHEQLAQIKYLPGQGMVLALAKVYARLGRFDEILAHSPAGNLAVFRISPDFDALRADPKFQRWVAAQPDTKPAMDSKPRSQAPGSPSPLPVDSKSVAVLAFANLSDDKANEYFSDGISEELLNVLAKVPGLKVTARTSAFYFKGKDTPVPEIAQKLGVAYVVEGSVRKQGDKVRITAQLIKAADGFHVWSENYDRELKDVFGIQSEVAGRVAAALKVQVMGVDRLVAVKTPTANLQAYQLYQTGRFWWNKRTKAGMEKAIETYQAAIGLDPDYADAHAGLAAAFTLAQTYLGTPAAVAQPKARAAALRALALDPSSAEARATLGSVAESEYDWSTAEREYRQAIASNPNYATAHHWLADDLIMQGRVPEAQAAVRRAAELDPLSLIIIATQGRSEFALGNHDEAIRILRRGLELDPNFVVLHEFLGSAYLGQGQGREAVAEFKKVRFLSPESAYGLGELGYALAVSGDREGAHAVLREIDGWRRGGMTVDLESAKVCLGLGDLDQTFGYLAKAVAAREIFFDLKAYPRWQALHADHRWQELMRQMNLKP